MVKRRSLQSNIFDQKHLQFGDNGIYEEHRKVSCHVA